MKCTHCEGNIVKSYDNRARPRDICLQCGRDASHKCNRCCAEIKGRTLNEHIDAKLSQALKARGAAYASA